MQSLLAARLVSRRVGISAFSPCATTVLSVPNKDDNLQDGSSCRYFASGRNTSKSFRPRRRANKNYRPYEPKPVKKEKHPELNVNLGEYPNAVDELEETFGHFTAEAVRKLRNEQANRELGGGEYHDDMEEQLRASDYLTAEPGSTEELIYERKTMEHMTDEEKEKFQKDIADAMKHATKTSVEDDFENNTIRELKPPKPKKGEEFAHLFMDDEQYADFFAGDEMNPKETNFEPNRLAHGEWTDMVVDVRRGIHLWRGGRLETYRAMVVGGNLNGCGGFGVGSHPEPLKAVELAARKCRRNIFFVDRYHGNGLTRDLVGVQNNTKCIIRATDNGLRGNPLMMEILLRFGISNGSCKAHGKRHLWNVVRATFKALCTHESIEDIALKRGKRIVSLDRALRVQV